MIVTSVARSGSTKYCMDLAKMLDVPLYDEIFNYEVAHDHKQRIHEATLTEIHPRNPAFLKTLDLKNCVVNNHSINYFSLAHTDIFVSRQNIQDSFWSLLAYAEKYYLEYTKDTSIEFLEFLLRDVLVNEALKAQFFYEYCIEFNKKIVIPDLVYSDTKIFREKYARFEPLISKFKIQVPKNLRYE